MLVVRLCIIFIAAFAVVGVFAVEPQKGECRGVAVEYQKIRDLEFTGWECAESLQTLVVDSLVGYNPRRVKLTRWGGRCDISVPKHVIGKSGYFRVARVGERWYFVDPDDGLLIMSGVQGLGECAGRDNEQQWAKATARMLRNNGFDNVSFGALNLTHYTDVMGAGVGETILADKAANLSYIDIAFMLRSFVWSIDFDDKHFNRLMAVFHPNYLAYIDEYAKERCAKFVNDKHCVGYFIDNELGFLGWRKMFADQTILLRNFLGITDRRNTYQLPDKYSWARDAALKFLAERGVAPDDITDADDEAFRAYVADYYYRTTSEALRRHDPNHLILGSRLHGFGKYDSITVAACGRWCDVVSLNYYGKWTPESEYMCNLGEWSGGKPFMVTEFYIKGEDAVHDGVPYENKEGGGWLVHTQADRGRFYQNFTLHLLQSKSCVGWIHFKYRDTPYRGKSGGRAYCNKGIVDMNCMPYVDFLNYIRQVNRQKYQLIDYLDSKSERN